MNIEIKFTSNYKRGKDVTFPKGNVTDAFITNGSYTTGIFLL